MLWQQWFNAVLQKWYYKAYPITDLFTACRSMQQKKRRLQINKFIFYTRALSVDHLCCSIIEISSKFRSSHLFRYWLGVFQDHDNLLLLSSRHWPITACQVWFMSISIGDCGENRLCRYGIF